MPMASTRARAPDRPMGPQALILGAPHSALSQKNSLYLRRERRGRFSKFGGLGFRYRGIATVRCEP
jgi:hypothetical protein